MKKVRLLLLTVLIGMFVISCSTTESIDLDAKAEVNAASSNPVVQLVRSTYYKQSRYGMSQQNRSVLVKVKNLDYQKHLTLYGELSSGNWVEIMALEYQESLPDGYELWKGSIAPSGSTELWGDEYVIRYLVPQGEYWDNNGGQNYSFDYTYGPDLAEPYNVLLDSASLYSGNLNGRIDVRNLGYHKSVKVVYTTDNWQTTKTADARFSPDYYWGYCFVKSPNANGIERWLFNINIGSASSVEYVIAYEVNGTTYWDNNFGKNYSAQNQ